MKTIILNTFLFAIALSAKAQTIPNGSFETWTNIGGVETPTGWDVSQSLNCTPFSSSKSIDKDDGAFAILLETANCIGSGGVHEGFAISSFPVNSKPLFLNGSYKSERVNSDSAQIKIVMKFIGVNIGSGKLNIYANSTGYVNFSIPIIYGVNAVPEDAQILCFSDRIGNSVLGNKLWVDKLSFSNLPLTTRNIIDANNAITIFPNPAANQFNISATNAFLSEINILNTMGAIVKTIKTYSNSHEVDISNLSAGIYFVKVNGQVIKLVKE
jgi:Secretion system C-terminal sorting domain